MTYRNDDDLPPSSDDVSGLGWDQPPIYELPPEDLPLPSGQAPFGQAPFGQGPAGPPYGAAWASPDAHTAWSAVPLPPPLSPPSVRRRRWPIVLASAATVLLMLVGGASVLAYRALRSSGIKPERAIPADAFALITMDLDPAASQKIAAIRFAHRLPDVGAGFGDKTDPKLSIFNAFARAGRLPDGLSYDRDIKPWIGDRIALVGRPAATAATAATADSGPDVLIAVQTGDAKRAESAVRRIAAKADQPVGVADGNGYVLIADSQSVADRAVADAKKSDLADRTDYRADMSALGQLGVASGWVDAKAAVAAVNSSDSAAGSPLLGGLFGNDPSGAGSSRISFTVRFTATAAELVVRANTEAVGPAAAPSGPQLIAGLPQDTAAAIEVRGAAGAFGKSWNRALKSASSDQLAEVDALGEQIGLRLPADIDTLLGTDLVAGLDLSQGLDAPNLGARSKTDPTAAAKVIDSLKQALAAHDVSPGLQMVKTSDGVVVANTDAYAAVLAASSGQRLGDSAAFQAAVPDQANAMAIGYLNLDVLSAAMQKAGDTNEDLKALHAFKSVGLSMSVKDGSTLLKVRLVAH